MQKLMMTAAGIPVLFNDTTMTMKAVGRNRAERRANASKLRRTKGIGELLGSQDATRHGLRLPPGVHR